MPETPKKWNIPGDVMSRIIYDVAGGVPPEKSVLSYNDEMHEFRDIISKEWMDWKKDNPDAELYAPEDLPSANSSFGDEAE